MPGVQMSVVASAWKLAVKRHLQNPIQSLNQVAPVILRLTPPPNPLTQP